MLEGKLLNRREFIRMCCYTGLGMVSWGLTSCDWTGSRKEIERAMMSKPEPGYKANTEPTRASIERPAAAKVYMVKTRDRREGVKRLLALLGPLPYAGKSVLVKPNFNTADPAPGSTHNDTLEQLLIELKTAKPLSIAVGERSGPPLTESVLKQKGVIELCDRLGVKLIDYDKLPPEGWVKFWREGLHWKDGFYVAKPVLEADINIGTCTLKTHAYGGVFSMSLKLAVGITPRRGYPFMRELHSSPHMGKMIAEINLAYTPDFVLMDGVDVFVDGGPDRGTRREGNVMLLSRDRVALDAVGLAVLKDLGSNREIMEVPIFKQEQISRAVELGLGVGSPDQIEIITDDKEGREYASRLEKILRG